MSFFDRTRDDDDRCQRNGSLARMPINLRYDLRFRFDQTLVDRLEAAWRRIDQLGEGAVKPRWWEAFHAGQMRRGLVRHRSAYRLKAAAHAAFAYLAALEPETIILLPFMVVARLIAPSLFQSPAELMSPYRAYLLRCEIEDLHDELRRRSRRRALRVLSPARALISASTSHKSRGRRSRVSRCPVA